MAVISENRRNDLWFGTVSRMQFIPTPNRGADVSPVGWQAGGELLSGGAYQLKSFNSSKNYAFEWPQSSSREAAQLMKSYADGTYGRGLIYFVDPLIYDMNVLPALWADPSMAITSESNTLVPGVTPTATPTTGFTSFNLPVQSAFYNLGPVGVTPVSSLDDSNSVFIPIPEGFQLNFGAFYSYTGSARVYYSPVSVGGTAVGQTIITPSTGNLFNTVYTPQPGDIGVRVWVGKFSAAAATITISAVHARLSRTGTTPTGPDYWVGGQGHSGCQFMSMPTYVNNTGVNGGQISYAASFREIGSWVKG